MNGIEVTIIGVLASCVVATWIYSLAFWKNEQGGRKVTNDAQRDAELVLREGLNLMDPKQLAEAQLADDGPFQIVVFAPDPLENYSEEVYLSTLAWARIHIDEVDTAGSGSSTSLLKDKPKMVFWCRRSEGKPRMLNIVRRVHRDMSGDPRVFELFGLVKAPDHLFFVDMTVHRYRTRQIKAYINARVNGVTHILLQLPDGHAIDLVNMFSHWLRSGTESTVRVEEAGSGMVPTADSARAAGASTVGIRCWTISEDTLLSEDTRSSVQGMFAEDSAKKIHPVPKSA